MCHRVAQYPDGARMASSTSVDSPAERGRDCAHPEAAQRRWASRPASTWLLRTGSLDVRYPSPARGEEGAANAASFR